MSFNRKNLMCTLSIAIATAIGAPAAFAAGPLEYNRINLGTLNGDGPYNEFIVKYKDGSTQRASQSKAALSIQNATTTAFPAAPAPMGLRGVGVAPGSKVVATHQRRLAVGADVFTTSRDLDRAEAEALMRQIAADPNVEYVERSVWMVPFFEPNDPFYEDMWHLHSPEGQETLTGLANLGGINMPGAWDKADGDGVVVAVLDTGVTEHPDLSGNTLFDFGYDFVSHTGNVRGPGGYDTGDWCDGAPSSWHGTHVSGTVAALTDNEIGVAGVAPKAAILPVRVLGRCGGSTADIVDALVWTAGGTVSGIPNVGVEVDVINMSLGSRSPATCPNVYKDALSAVHQAGITVVVAAGNSSADVTSAGGVGYTMGNCSDDIIVVGGNGPTGLRGGVRPSTGATTAGSGSNHGVRVDISAPYGSGWDWWEDQVLSTWNEGETAPGDPGYGWSLGTSMASPHVAGVVALMQGAAETKLTPAEVKAILKETARSFPAGAPDYPLGAGILDADAAVTRAVEGPCDPEVEECEPAGPEAIVLVNKVDVTGLSGGSGSETLFSFEAQAGQVLSILTLGGTGNVSVYVSFEQEPSAASHQFKSERPGNNETVRITSPQAGTYYIKLVGTQAYSGVTLVARQ